MSVQWLEVLMISTKSVVVKKSTPVITANTKPAKHFPNWSFSEECASLQRLFLIDINLIH